MLHKPWGLFANIAAAILLSAGNFTLSRMGPVSGPDGLAVVGAIRQ